MAKPITEYVVYLHGTYRKNMVFRTGNKTAAQAKLAFLIGQDPEGRYSVEKQTSPYCGWFALCVNRSTTTRDHPVLGMVPICKRCDDKVARLERGTR